MAGRPAARRWTGVSWPNAPAAVRPLAAALVLLAACAPARAQTDDLAPLPPDTTARRYGQSAALLLVLTEDGLGAGVATRAAVTDDVTFTAELRAGAARDEREQQFFVGLFGDTVTPFKRHYVAIVPLQFGAERRLFRNVVEDNFRPFVALAAGPSLAVQWPYFDDADGDGVRQDGERIFGLTEGLGRAETRLGVGGTAALGAYFGRSRRSVQGLRIGLALHYFPVAVDLLEADPAVERPSRKTFVSPTVSFHLLRLLR